MSFASRFFLTYFKPLDVFSDIRENEEPSFTSGLPPILFVGLLWSVFCAWLAADRMEPSFSGNFIPLEAYYHYQVYFLTPVLAVGIFVLSLLSHSAARIFGGDGNLRTTFSCIAYAYSAPLTLIIVLPESVLYRLEGFDILAKFIRFGAPVAAIWILLLCSVSLVRTERISFKEAFIVTIPSFLVHGAFVGLFLR